MDFIVNFEDQIAELKKYSQDGLKGWLERALAGNDPSPIIWTTDALFDDMIVQIYRASRDVIFQQKLKEALTLLVWSWSEKTRSFEYFSSLLMLVGRLKVVEVYDRLLDYANKSDFKGRIIDGEDLHRRVLRVLLGQGIASDSALSVCKRDIREELYAALCYRALYEHSLTNGFRYLPLMARHAVKDPPSFHLDVVLDRFICKATFNWFNGNMKTAFRKMKPEEQSVTLIALEETGRAVLFHDEDIFIYPDLSKDDADIPVVPLRAPKIEETTICNVVNHKFVEAERGITHNRIKKSLSLV